MIIPAHDHVLPLITINVIAQAPLKLTNTNYSAWRMQFNTLLIGYDLVGFVDGTRPCPTPTLTTTNGTTPNPAYSLWVRQDQLILNAIIGSISPTIIPFIATATTSRDAWTTLFNTYAKPSRGRIMSLKGILDNLNKGEKTITEYMQIIKTCNDELLLMNAAYDIDELTLKILRGLGDEYSPLASAVKARETPVSFDELHEKLITYEAQLKQDQDKKSLTPASAYLTTKNPTFSQNPHYKASSYRRGPSLNTSPQNAKPHPHQTRPQPKPYRGFCQLCGTQGHSAKRCSTYKHIPWTDHSSPHARSPTAQAHFTSPTALSSGEWLLDSGTSHHVTSDLQNLSLHSESTGHGDIMIGDGTGLPITHTGFSTLQSSHNSFRLHNVLYVPSMKRNLISVSQFCLTNNVSIEFLPHSFLVKDLRTGQRF